MTYKYRIVEITKNKGQILSENLEVNIIHNRFDILYSGDFLLLKIDSYYVPVKILKKKRGFLAKVGLYLRKLPLILLDELFAYVFKKFPYIDSIEIKHCYTELEEVEKYPYWHVVLPNSIEEFDEQLSRRVRYNTKYYPKKLQKEKSCELVVDKLSSFTDSPEMYVKTYLDWKKASHNYIFSGTEKDFLTAFGITDTYILKLRSSEKEEILAIGFICDLACGNVYFENFSINQNYSKYSVGMILYYSIIKDLIKNHKKTFYLSGGNLEYKRHYNGILTWTYSKSIKNPHPLRYVFKILHKIGFV